MIILNNRKTIALLLFGLLVFGGFIFAQTPVPIEKEKNIKFFIHGSYNMVQEMGSTGDYVAGENDFPVTPSHNEVGGGLQIMYHVSPLISIGLLGEYLTGTDVEKIDPSDNETYTYTTYDNVNILANVYLKFGDELKFFVNAGAGFNMLMPYNDKEETGSLGSIIIVTKPDNSTNFIFAAGGGIMYDLGGVTAKLEGQYISNSELDKNSIIIRIGIGF
ncbi:MAG: hypothetical protein JW737_09735 [Acidobacteria bacterium]|nr:hypothetical protein [Acidobacteriota bacterium]